MNNYSPRNCMACGKKLVGRRDKRYCDTECRNKFHNQNRSDGELFMSQVNSKLRMNRKILKTMSPEGKATIRKEIMDKMGYDYREFTGLFKSKKSLYYLVYDYAFTPIMDNGKEKVFIVQRQDYMNKLGFELWKKENS